uniref:Uncharacterized protein n=1 Tax=Candidatus Kentrum eta TaxID=2126337 RepID=A0A450UYT0_9GAMM|nr:MAG: hypothetical protein BECKH772A_GA0070896_1001314 [Candidatus Kentron sp. H]VFJ91225.1 MAG: hypothetical protein BECKH772B_GA0070898_1001512 [Candidatus Kentron sp. H]VFJ97710.1 MAG: hypothetical protein BECKH772C_GA0070978_1001513 [Candidatus Kentron sp. H]
MNDEDTLRSCLEIRIVEAVLPIVAPARRDGGENKDCSGLHGAPKHITNLAPVATRQDAIRAPLR